jgi:hypothetical protein
LPSIEVNPRSLELEILETSTLTGMNTYKLAWMDAVSLVFALLKMTLVPAPYH